jgi:hypothetical protein
MMKDWKKKYRRHPLDLKTGRALFTPVRRATGERLELEVEYDSFPRTKALGYRGTVQDLQTGKWYAIYGKECSVPGCRCDAWVEEVPDPSSAATHRG